MGSRGDGKSDITKSMDRIGFMAIYQWEKWRKATRGTKNRSM